MSPKPVTASPDEAWAEAESALIAFQGDEDGFAVNIAHWPEFPDKPWVVSATIKGDMDEVAVTGATLRAALQALARALRGDKP